MTCWVSCISSIQIQFVKNLNLDYQELSLSFHARTHARTHKRMRWHTHLCLHPYTHTHRYTGACVCEREWESVCMNLEVRARVCVWDCVWNECVSVCMCVYQREREGNVYVCVVSVYMCVSVRVCVRVRVKVCVCVYVCMWFCVRVCVHM